MSEERRYKHKSLDYYRSENPLIYALFKHGADSGLSFEQLAGVIEVTPIYLRALGNGARPVSGLGRDKLRTISEILGLTFVQVLMMAEVILPTDFASNQEADLDRELETAWKTMQEHPDWGRMCLSPDEWASLSRRSKYGIILMWEQICQRDLIEKGPLILMSPRQEEMPRSTTTSHPHESEPPPETAKRPKVKRVK